MIIKIFFKLLRKVFHKVFTKWLLCFFMPFFVVSCALPFSYDYSGIPQGEIGDYLRAHTVLFKLKENKILYKEYTDLNKEEMPKRLMDINNIIENKITEYINGNTEALYKLGFKCKLIANINNCAIESKFSILFHEDGGEIYRTNENIRILLRINKNKYLLTYKVLIFGGYEKGH